MKDRKKVNFSAFKLLLKRRLFLAYVCLAGESGRRQRADRSSEHGCMESPLCDMDTFDWLRQSLCQRIAGV